jgi:beta-glucosidase
MDGQRRFLQVLKSMNHLKKCTIILFYSPMLALVAAGQTTSPQDPDARARQIVSQMTLDEKIDQLHGTASRNEYRVVRGLPRLGIPAMPMTNGPAGSGRCAGPGHGGPATALPAPISTAATWDVAAAELAGDVAGSETRTLGNSVLESPTINICRTPRNGRTFEGYGEDPFLTGEIVVGNITGLQRHVIANVKHFACNNQEQNRLKTDTDVDERTMREIYLPGFEAAIIRGHCGSIMAAYNRLNGAFCCENRVLLNDILKKDWGFDGFVFSDFGAVHNTVACVTGGLDLEMPTGEYFGDDLKLAVRSGLVRESDLDDKLIRRYRTMMRLGQWDRPDTADAEHGGSRKPGPLPAPSTVAEPMYTSVADLSPEAIKEGGAADRRMAAEGAVLLKNDGGLLPLDPTAVKSVALIGPDAGKVILGGGGSAQVDPTYWVDPPQALREKFKSVAVDDGSDIARATSVAKAADVVLIMLFDHQREGRDHELKLDGNQDALTAAVLAANPKSIVVLRTGGPVLMPWIDHAPAVLEMWYPGQEDGHALVDILTGTVNPSGRLPITFPKNQDDGPLKTAEQYPGVDGMIRYTEGVEVGYRYYDDHDVVPLFPFGFGLSYTTFAYSNLKATTTGVEFDLSNTGTRAGAEVPQLYIGIPTPVGITHMRRQLKGFHRVELAAGATAHVKFPVDSRSFSYWDVATHTWVIAPGDADIQVGGSSRDARLTQELRVK